MSYWGLEYALPLLGKKCNLPTACLPLLGALTPDEHRLNDPFPGCAIWRMAPRWRSTCSLGVFTMNSMAAIQMSSGGADRRGLSRLRCGGCGSLATGAATMGPLWTALKKFDQVLPDLNLMRDVAQHIDEYGRDGDNRRHCNPITGQRVGRRCAARNESW